jgi:hypothetical protein
MNWFKATKCADGNCVEVAYKKSTKCAGGDCVEVGHCACEEIHIRDSKNPTGPVLTFTQAEWVAFVAGAKRGEFDL